MVVEKLLEGLLLYIYKVIKKIPFYDVYKEMSL